jgi:GTP-binding protein LepA
MQRSHIRNFSIIAHIDHGKSTLADRMLELTGTVEQRKMREQVLDEMELERERGITIKMTPARMRWQQDGEQYLLNLIDTPGHIDFSYEVSRAMKAVEGAILLVDATQGVQAQTLTTLYSAQELGLTIIPVLSKIDADHAQPDVVAQQLAQLLHCSPDDVIRTSGKTGEGVAGLLKTLCEQIPAPETAYPDTDSARALVFDFDYSSHRGIVVYVRVFDGTMAKGDALSLIQAEATFQAIEVGTFAPETKSTDQLETGEIGYIVTGIKRAGIASVGDTLTRQKKPLPALAGYMHPKPVVWASIFPESQDDFSLLRQALERLKLSDSSLSFEEEASNILGRGFRCGFLGMLHLEIVTERLRREFDLAVTVTTPSITYEVHDKDGTTDRIYSPAKFPDDGSVQWVQEPWVNAKVITPGEYIGPIIELLYEHEAILGDSDTFEDGRTTINVEMPLRELMREFFGKLKSHTSGFASLSYEIADMRPADVVRLDLLVAEELVPAFSRIVARRRVQEEAEQMVDKLYELLPRQMFVTKIQARAMGRIISARKLPALRKDVTAPLYGGDVTRKRKLLEKQKKGKKKMQSQAKVNIPQDVFMKMMRGDS